MSKKREIFDIVLGFSGAMLALYGVVMFNQHILMALPLGVRMIAAIITYWPIALIPAIIMVIRRDTLSDYGFSPDRICRQILVGLGIGLLFSAAFTLLPHLLGLGHFVGSGKPYAHLWQFAYEFLYCILAVGLVEEFLFRGFLYAKIRRISSDPLALLLSSALFGLFHLFAGNVLQMIGTALLGAVWCLCRSKVKHCTTLSLAVAHGIYDAMITVWAFVFL